MGASTATAMREPGTELKREFSLWSAFALAFAFISPIVALYAIFGFAFVAAGPAMWWAFPIVLAGQLLVAATFAELASKWPYEGAVYQWARRLRGESYGWWAGWAYIWTLIIAAATVCYGAAGFVPVVLGVDKFTSGVQLLVALGFVVLVSIINTIGRGAMKLFVALSITAEVIGSIGVGIVLLLFHREQSIGSLFETAGAGQGPGGYLWSGLLAAVAFVGWAFVGFETAGAISEEVHDPRRSVPKAIMASLVLVAVVVMFAALGVILAIKDFGAVIAGKVADPIADTVTGQLGSGVTRPLFFLFIIGFMASALALQASASRLIFAFAREGVLPASGFLRTLSEKDRLPINAIVLAGIVAALVLITTQSENVYFTLISFTVGGFFIAFAFPIIAVTFAHVGGRFVEGPWNTGRLGFPLAAAASVWTVFEFVNIAWPRATDLPWNQEYGVLLTVAVIGVIGLGFYLARRREIAEADARLKSEVARGDEVGPADELPVGV
jgi:amino acid transporter